MIRGRAQGIGAQIVTHRWWSAFGFRMNDGKPQDETQILCDRTTFLQEMFADEERGQLRDEAHYVAKYPTFEEFVREEYAVMRADLADEGVPLRHAQYGRYRIVRELARGGMGTVYEAIDPELKRRCVIKMLHSAMAMDAMARERLRREAQVLGGLDHPSLLSITDVVEEDGELALVMPYFEGATLAEHIARARARRSTGAIGPWLQLREETPDRASCVRDLLRYFSQAAAGLHAAHEAGVVHRDIKPDNLLVTEDGSVVVLDFGLARMLSEDRFTSPGELLGTPLYMAPESIEGQDVDSRSDVYSLGLTLYESLTLKHPFAGGDNRAATFQKILQGGVVDARKLQPLLSRDLAAVVMRAIERVPNDRYPTAGAFAADLRRLLDLEPTHARPVSGIAVAWRRVRRRPQLPVLLTLLVLVCCAFAMLWDQHLHVMNEVGKAMGDFENKNPEQAERRIKEVMRSLPATVASGGILLVHPRGLTASFDQFEWLGNAPGGGPDGEVLQHRYRVELFVDGEHVWQNECTQSTDSRWCALKAPVSSFDPGDGRMWSWRVDWLGDGLPVSDGMRAELREDPDGLAMLEATCAFDWVSVSESKSARLSSATTFAELNALIDAGYASLALSRLSAMAAKPDPALSERDRLNVQLYAARKLGASRLEKAAADSLHQLKVKR
ncbi:MAG: tRNA A-37 threonylcarbamoyl transferase component Bud32 [Neolewinella sp.]|jgi:tRNA A-37 threonylcarbamoyl transferase component Bud32